jgi:hypothetical protein
MLTTIPWRMMARGCALGVLSGLLVVAFESDFPGQICEYNQATKHEYCTTYSIFPFLLIKVGKTLNDYDVAITALATVLLTFVTGGLVWIGYVQLRTTRAQLRAYVFISGAHLENIGVGQIPYAQLTIKNSGQTPAYKMTQWAMVGIGKFPLETHPTTNESEPMPERPLPPQAEIPLQSPKYKTPLNAEMLDELSKGMLAIYVTGEIRYRDAFKKKCCTRYLLYSGGSIGFSGQLAAYKDGNDAT